MADPRFFNPPRPRTLGDIAALAGAQVKGDAHRIVASVAPLDKAGPEDLSFLDNARYKDAFRVTKAGACVIHPNMAGEAPEGVSLLLSPKPYKAYALIAQALYPEDRPQTTISDKASIAPTALVGAGCTIEAGAVIGEGAVLGEECWIEPNAVIGRNVVIGKKSRVGANASVSYAVIGEYVRLYPGARVGQDGFGFAIDPAGHVKVPQLGRVIIGDHVEVGANSCIDRGAGPDTVIGDGTWIDNLVQIGHNVRIGRGCVLVGQSGVAGSAVLEDFVVLAAQAGIAGHLKIGMGAQIGGQSGVIRDIPARERHMGSPSMPAREFMRLHATLKRLTNRQKSE